MKNGIFKEEDAVRYYKDDLLHREDGPAVEYAGGSKYWYLHGKLHREDGSAVEYASGTKEWWINEEKLTKKEVLLAQKMLAGKMWDKLPLYVNHPKLKYVAKKMLESNS